MAKGLYINGVDWDAKAFNLTEEAATRVYDIYNAAIKEAIGLYGSITTPKIPFSFSDYPQLKKRVNTLFSKLAERLLNNMNTGTEELWNYANDKNDALLKEISRKTGIIPDILSPYSKKTLGSFGTINLKALQAFQTRKDAGLDLSDRVWKYTNQAKFEIEMGIDGGIAAGRSAAAMGRDLRSNLLEPERLYRRVRNKNGNLQLSQRAKACNPGQGVYRSSAKNALRLTRNEVNMAYRTSDYNRWQGMPFIVGIRVQLSNNPHHCPLCELLAGKYPKDFLFRGWHVQCRCFATPIMLTPDEYDKFELQGLNSEDNSSFKSSNTVKDIPRDMKEWFDKNKERLSELSSTPYFLKDNEDYFNYPI